MLSCVILLFSDHCLVCLAWPIPFSHCKYVNMKKHVSDVPSSRFVWTGFIKVLFFFFLVQSIVWISWVSLKSCQRNQAQMPKVWRFMNICNLNNLWTLGKFDWQDHLFVGSCPGWLRELTFGSSLDHDTVWQSSDEGVYVCARFSTNTIEERRKKKE